MDFFKLVAPVYDTAMKITGHNKTLAELVEHIDLQPGQRLLDLGGGTGQILEELPGDKGLKVIIADPSEAMLSKAQERITKLENGFRGKGEAGLKAELVEATGDALPFGDNSFDHVTIADVLHHFNNIEKTFVEIKRVLKPGG